MGLIRGPLGKMPGKILVGFEAPQVSVGDVLRGHLVLTITKATTVRRLEAVLWGGEHGDVWTSSSDGPPDHRTGSLASIEERLPLEPSPGSPEAPRGKEGAVKLEPGDYLFTFKEAIPKDAPTSWSGASTSVPVAKARDHGGNGFSFVGVKYEVRARADVGLTGELLETAPFEVVGPLAAPEFKAGAARPRKPKGPAMEVFLDYTNASPLGLLRGRVGLSGVPLRRLRAVRMALIEEIGAKEIPDRNPLRWERRVLAEVEIPGSTVGTKDEAFEIRVPEGTAETRPGTIAWRTHYLEARADIALARDLKARVDVRVLKPAAALQRLPSGKRR